MSDLDVSALLSSRQVAQKLGVSMKTIERMRKSGRIPSYKLMSRFRYDLEEVRAALIARRRRPKPQEIPQ